MALESNVGVPGRWMRSQEIGKKNSLKTKHWYCSNHKLFPIFVNFEPFPYFFFPVGPCVGQTNGMYQINCTHYRECCGQKVQRETPCPTGSSFHPTLKICVEQKVYTCGGKYKLPFLQSKISNWLCKYCSAKSNGFSWQQTIKVVVLQMGTRFDYSSYTSIFTVTWKWNLFQTTQ